MLTVAQIGDCKSKLKDSYYSIKRYKLAYTVDYRASNSVLNVLTNANENVLLQLLYTNCVPIISYACSVIFFSATEMTNCNTAINNVIRKIFGFQ